MVERVGQHLGHYQLLQLLHQGNYADVYLAEHRQLGTQAAIKVLKTRLTGEDSEHFRTEARTIARLAHPHIVRVLDVGIEDSVPYLVMQYAPKGTLRQRLPQHIPLSPAAVLPIIQQMADALHYAHDQQVVHRNIKPENILLNARAEMQLSDFSIAILEQKLRYQSTQDAAAIAYMAPEQIRGQPIPASDQYALGIVAYEWLAGERPFAGSLREIGAQHLTTPPPPLREKAPHISRALEEVISTALAKDPRTRYPNVDAFAQAFRMSIEGPPTAARRPPAPANTPPRERDFFGSPPRDTVPPIRPPARTGVPSMQGLPSREGPSGSSPFAGAAPFSQRANFSASDPETQQRFSSPIGPPALRPPLDLALTPPPRKGRPGLFVSLIALALIIVVVSSLGVLGVRGSGPLASLFGSQGAGTPGVTATTGSALNGKNCTKVGLLMPDSISSSRWEAYDHPLLFQQLEANGFSSNNIDYANANGDSNVQLAQAKSDLAKGDCILIVAAEDSLAAAAIVTAARKQQVPVIAYDRFIFSDDLNFYASFDGVAVGKLQGQYIVDHYQDFKYGVRSGHNNIAFINGSQADNNATLFANGAHEVLDPLIADQTLNKVYEQFTPNWDPPTAQKEIEAALNQTNNNIQLVLSANDDMGGAAIQALAARNLAGKVLVTGQDATVNGLRRILEGTQAMTVYKPIIKEATAAAQLAAALRDGKDIAALTKGQTTKNPQGSANIPSVLETPIAVDKTNMASTVIADNYVTQDQLCTGLPEGTDTTGICP
jgi:D-xylose transport system substrate-binding protein